MKTLLRVLVVSAIAFIAPVASASPPDSVRVITLDSPAAGDALTPYLAGAEDGLYLSWLERRGEGHALVFSFWDGKDFTEPRTIHESERFFANWADFASLLPLADGRLAAHWLEKAGEGSYEYDVWISLSSDGGESWSQPERPHRDGTLSEHGFVSLARHGDDGFDAVWLDGRKFQKDGADNEMTLMSTTFEGEDFGDEVLLDGRVCECCQTAMARTPDGLFVAYRDRSPEEIRDIAFVRFAEGKWSAPERLHPDDWRLAGCPVNGPQASAAGDRLAVAWFTASADDPRVQVVFSEDGGRSFGEPIRVDDGEPVGRVDVELAGESAVLSWIERVEGRTGEVKARRVSPSGAREASVSVARTASGRASGFPRMARFGEDLFITWTEAQSRNAPSRVRVARLALAPDMPDLIDEPAIDFAAAELDGAAVRLSELTGKVVLLNFWGIWCKSCREEIPHLVELDREWRDEGLVVLGADYGDAPEDLPAFVEELGMSYPVLVDDGLAEDYEVLVFPTSVVIDRSGRVRYRVEGYRPESFEKLTEVIRFLLEDS